MTITKLLKRFSKPLKWAIVIAAIAALLIVPIFSALFI